MFHVLGENTDNFVSLGYFSGYNASPDPNYMYLVDAPRKIMWNIFFDFSVAFFLVKESADFLCCNYPYALILPCLQIL